MNASRHPCAISSVVLILTMVTGSSPAAVETADACLSASQLAFDSLALRKLRAMRNQLLACAAAACPSEVQLECQRRADEIHAALPSIVFTVRDANEHKLSAVTVTMDDEVLTHRLDGTAIEVEPGEHRFRFESLGQSTQERFVDVRRAEKDRHEVVVLQAMPAVARPAPAIAAPHPTKHAPASAVNIQHKLAMFVGGFGLVGIGIGTAYGWTAISRKHDAEARCPHQCADAQGVAQWDSAQAAGNVATMAFVVGGIGLVGGGVLWATSKRHPRSAATVSIGPSAVSLAGNW